MWGSDLTSVMTGEGQAAVFAAVDHCSAECVGLHASHSADRFQALEPVRQGVRERFGASAKDIARGLELRHDHGSQYVSHHFQSEIRFLGVASSPAFVREPEGPVSSADITHVDGRERKCPGTRTALCVARGAKLCSAVVE
jgi:transposase InsO family protein